MTTGQGGTSSGKGEPPATDQREIEWQLDAADLDPVEGWLGRHTSESSGLVVDPEPTVEITDAYYDTEDWRLYRAGYALRVRETDGAFEATMKSLTPYQDSLRNRREISEPLRDDDPATLGGAGGPVGRRSRLIVGGHGLRRLFPIRTRRRRFALLLGDSSGEDRDFARAGELSLDASELSVGGELVCLRRVEVEAEPGTAPGAGLQGLVDEMQATLDLTPATLSKYETGLYACGFDPEGDNSFGPTHIDPSMSVGEVAFAVLRRQFAEMRSHEAGTRLGEDPEELHDMRVPTRRMRAAIKAFENVLPEKALWFGEELRWVAKTLGEVRDLDVQIERFEAMKREADRESTEYLERIVRITQKRRVEARTGMLAVLDSGRYERLESSLSRMLRLGPGGEPSQTDGHDPAGAPVTAAAPALISRRYRKWRKSAKRIDEASSPEALHDVRKKGKLLRYTLEFFSEVYGEPVQRLVKPLKALQDDLGDHQDAEVAAGYLRDLGTTTGGMRVPRKVAFVMGVYSERCDRWAEDLRHALPGSKPFRDLERGKKWKEFWKVLEDRYVDPVPSESIR
jgi:CHAD domain-containing protein